MQLDENVYQGGDIFKTKDDEFIVLELQMKDFDEDELVKYVEFAESLYEKQHQPVSIYIICPGDINIYVREFEIKSEACFTIKLAKIDEDPAAIILKMIKHKLRNNEVLDEDDYHALEMIPVICEKEKRNYYRREAFKIINRLHY
ncbi:hypothetical protein [Methanobrevibacter sp.]|uniref:hypothetical protein n=1 Tax=Methanobrevibacter sp. TaxID=66852 RepID=UPI0025CFBC24|nr:hypothetical protein [Methanobrevibacter sp.]MBQ2831059.1 hypothetical protein [Methanobrevibacter sp.]